MWGVVLFALVGGVWWGTREGGRHQGAERSRAPAVARPSPWLDVPVPPPRGTRTLSGKVVGPEGPVEGAVVVATVSVVPETLLEARCDCAEPCELPLLAPTCETAARTLAEWVEARRGEAPPLARVTTDAEGRFELAGLEEGAHALWAEHASGVGLREHRASGGVDEQVVLGGTRPLTGRVRDDEGRPVDGARVTAILVPHSRYFEAVSDARGLFRFPSLPPGGYVVVFTREGLLPVHAAVRDDAGPALEVTMPRARRVSGRVVRGVDAPVPGARVVLRGTQSREEATADGEGRFAFEGPGPGGYVLVASHEGEEAVGEVLVEQGAAPPDVTLFLGGGVRVHGTVRDARGNPIARAEVSLQGSSRLLSLWPERGQARTEADGTYRLGPLDAGRYTLSVSAPRFARWESSAEVDGVAPVDATLRESSGVEGKVMDAAGRPVKGARVALWRRLDSRGPTDADPLEADVEQAPGASTETAEDGAFLLDAAAPGRWLLTVSHPEHSSRGLPVTSPSQGLRVVLETGASVQGQVVTAAGVPVRGATVTLLTAGKRILPWRVRQVETGGDGTFALKGVVAGRYSLAARTEGVAGGQGVVITLDVNGSDPSEQLLRIPEAGSISGRVVDEQSRPLSGASIRLVADISEDALARMEAGLAPPSIFRGQVDVEVREDGRFEARPVDAGPYRVLVQRRGYRLDVAASSSMGPDSKRDGLRAWPGDVVTMVMRRQEGVRGRVAREDGSPVTRFELNGRPFEDAEGAFFAPAGHPESRSLTFVAAGLAPVTREVAVEAGREIDLGTIVLTPGRAVEGRVTDGATGAPIAGALVAVGEVPPDAEARRRPFSLSERFGAVRTGLDGAFHFPHVGPGPRVLMVEHASYLQKRHPLAEQDVSVSVSLEGGAVVRGSILGQRVPRSAVSLVGRSGNGLYVPVTEGRFEQRGVEAGTYVASVVAAEIGPRSHVLLPRFIEVPATGTVTVDFEARPAGASLRLSLPSGSEDALVRLIPGRVGPPVTVEDLRLLLHCPQRDHTRKGGQAVFDEQPAGPYTVFVIRAGHGATSLEVQRHELDLPETGEHVLPLAPGWTALPFAMSFQEARAVR
ncbi:carboxypeptidase-like regulatory domain-containing protein [Myxococcus stipitatus]|uniref:MSCRAMM family protein n=1 Tax=Myxococcus stipitatus TaxID=83455 RepID=UPI001F38632E|nr:carboxypeptidase-like regulatory domain-containing protein [Myxococcus stipitatus]MCE9666476.1 carboxypeptidase-like regulatory domain-containing protein [Myxococcus stipitatus]